MADNGRLTPVGDHDEVHRLDRLPRRVVLCDRGREDGSFEVGEVIAEYDLEAGPDTVSGVFSGPFHVFSRRVEAHGVFPRGTRPEKRSSTSMVV